MTLGESDGRQGNNSAVWLVPRCKTLRVSAGMPIQKLASEAGVDRATIGKIEKNQGVSEPLAHRVFNALNKRHHDRLTASVEITDNPRKR